jgi:hypothetical protein
MDSKEQEILKVLKDLLSLDDILACMVARKGMEGVVPTSDNFKIKDVGVWQVLQKTMDEFFDIIDAYSKYGLDKVYFELGEYDAMFYILPNTNVAVVAVVPALANRGLLEVELENSRIKILSAINRNQ